MAGRPHRLDDATTLAATLPQVPERFTADVLKEQPALGVYALPMTEAQGIRIEAKLDAIIDLLKRAALYR